MADSLFAGVGEAEIQSAGAEIEESKAWAREGQQRGFPSVGRLRKDSGKLAAVMGRIAVQNLFAEAEFHL